MRTSALIAALAADRQAGGMPLRRRYALALIVGVIVSAAAFAIAIGPRADIAHALGTMRFDWKFVDTIALAIPTVFLAWRSIRPDAKLGIGAILLLAPIAVLGGSVAMELAMVPRDLWAAKLIGSNWLTCLTLIPLLSVAPLAALILAMRSGAPASPRLAGAAAGLAAAALAATLYAANCTDDSPLFVAAWYSLATAIVVIFGVILGDRFLRW
ncbi:MAG TPA: DUF1109 domain-containing protein [Roseiarcus sp.]|nr:DUF1109 domain-containing protein [Roseiarcus sp.]